MAGSLRFGVAHPILRVENMQRALEFYVGKLGFENATWGSDVFTSVRRDDALLYLTTDDQGRGAAWVWVAVEDATALHEDLKTKGVEIAMPPTNFDWALEFHIEDPDGNVLRLASDPL